MRRKHPEDWTEYWRADALRRRRARYRRKQGWESLCSFMVSRRNPARAWRIFKALLRPTTPSWRPLLAVPISPGVPEEALAELFADKFARGVQALPPTPPALLVVAPAAPHDEMVVSLCSTDITLRELQTALNRCPKRRSAPGIDGVTYQMLRNQDAPS